MFPSRKKLVALLSAAIFPITFFGIFFSVVAAPGNPVLDPLANAQNVSVTTTVSIAYNEPVSPTTVSSQTFAVHAMQTGQLVETISVYSGTIGLTPEHPFHPGEWVQVTATTGTLGISGQGPLMPMVWQYRTEVAAGSGIFIDGGQSIGSNESFAVDLGDLDADGDLDAVSGGLAPMNRVWINDGAGNYSSGQQLGTGTSNAVTLGDLDGDSDLDVVIRNHVWLNNGEATFATTGQTIGDAIQDFVLGDLDGDGDLDLAVARAIGSGTPSKIYLNDGTGIFTFHQNFEGKNSYGIDVGDLDNDGDLDIYMATANLDRVWFNDGQANFSTNGRYLGNHDARDVALGDLDNDGDLDAFVVNVSSFQPDEIWLNDGDGNFTNSGQSLGNTSSKAVDLGDIDHDGDLDAFIAGIGNVLDENQIWVNDGNGIFTLALQIGGLDNFDVMFGDVDQDGDLDAFLGTFSYRGNIIFLNQNPVDLGVKKTVTPTAAVLPGDSLTYTLVFSNAGPALALGTIITDLVPVTLTNLIITSSGVAIQPLPGQTYVWSIEPLSPGEEGVITVTGIIEPFLNQEISITNTVKITSLNNGVLDTNQSNDADSVVSNVNLPPHADAGGPYATSEGSIILLEASNSSDPGNDVLLFAWDLDDDGAFDDDFGVTIPFSPPEDGLYPVHLLVTDEDGASDIDSVTVFVTNQPPQAEISIVSPINENELTTLSGTLSDAGIYDSYVLQVSWGDGISDTFNYSAGTSVFTENHIYVDDVPSGTASDLYTITLNLSDDDGGVFTTTKSVLVNNLPPILFNIAHPDIVEENEPVTLTGELVDASPIDSLIILIDWGDGITETLSVSPGMSDFTETHVYTDDHPTGTSSDIYPIFLTGWDDDGGITQTSSTLMVNNAPPTLSNLSITPIIQENDTATLAGEIQDLGTFDSFSLTVIWGDGASESISLPAGSEAFMLNHVYLDDVPSLTTGDLYTLTITLQDDDTGMDEDTLTILVNNLPPLVEAGEFQIAERDVLVSFTGSFTDTGSLDAHEILWDFGDGATFTGTLTPNHVYLEGGIYTVTLTVVDDDHGTGSDTLLVYINPIYTNDFEQPVGKEWCTFSRSATPSGRTFLGEFGNQHACLSLGNLPPSSQIQVSFDLFIIRSWDGNQAMGDPDNPLFLGPNGQIGPDRWLFSANDHIILDTTFTNWPTFRQAFPGNYPSGDFPAWHLAKEIFSLGYEFFGISQDSVYHLLKTFQQVSSTLSLDFSAAGLQGIDDESWGIDNIEIRLILSENQTENKVYLPIIMR